MHEPHQKLLPLEAPWTITTSAPFIRVHPTSDGRPSAVTFVAHFKLADRGDHKSLTRSVIAQEPQFFELLEQPDFCPYHMVRVVFGGGIDYRIMPSLSDTEVICEAAFDWSAIPGAYVPGEDIDVCLKRSEEFWLRHKISPDPGVYVVEKSDWLKHLRLNESAFKHYIILGQDEYVEVIAKSGYWEVGQAVDC